MLHSNVHMEDIDVAQWRNAQALLLDSAKERPRIVVLHDAGRIRKVAHSGGLPVRGKAERADDPAALAKALYEANQGSVDFVAVFERTAFDTYFARFQNTWDIDEDLDGFVQRTYAMLDQFPEGMVTYPNPARETLGLQWRIGCSREAVLAAARKFVQPNTTLVFGVFDGGELWASLVMAFDQSLTLTSVTTVDPSEVAIRGGKEAVAAAVVAWVRARHGSCSLGLFLDRPAAERFLRASDKAHALREASVGGELILAPVPPALAGALA